MIVVADSGSTKCDWILISSSGEEIKTQTMGFNPFFHDSALVASKISENHTLMEHSEALSAAYFYGAGCSSDNRKKVIEVALRNVFPNLQSCLVDHDLTGAAIATAEDTAGIACIMGTGSNSCYWDGKKAEELRPALGYVLGDEGSGSYFGKLLLVDWLYNRMPDDLQQEFTRQYDLTKEKIFRSVYSEPNANVYLASFMPFASAHKDHKYIKQMIYKGLARFISIHVWCYPNFRDVPVHFVGSIAHYFSEQLELVAFNHNFTVGKVVKRPVRSLAQYHYKKSFSEV